MKKILILIFFFQPLFTLEVNMYDFFKCHGLYDSKEKKCIEHFDFGKNSYSMFPNILRKFSDDFYQSIIYIDKDVSFYFEFYEYVYHPPYGAHLESTKESFTSSFIFKDSIKLKKGYNNINFLNIKKIRNLDENKSYLRFFYFDKEVSIKTFPISIGYASCLVQKKEDKKIYWLNSYDQNEDTAYHFKDCSQSIKKDTFFSIKLYDDPSLPEVLPKLKLYVRNGKKGNFKKFSRLKEIKVKTVVQEKIPRYMKSPLEKDRTIREKIITLKDTNDWQLVFSLNDIFQFNDFDKALFYYNDYNKFDDYGPKKNYVFKKRHEVSGISSDILFQLVSTYPGETDEVAITDFEWRVEP